MAVDEVSFSISQGTLPRQVATDYVGRNRPPNHTFDLSSRAVREISAYGEKCNHRPTNRSLL